MIKHKYGVDILNEETEAIINTVNCDGFMGKGLALQFKKKYPYNYEKYKQACEKRKVKVGKMFVFRTNSLFNPKYIINFPTKDHWQGSSHMGYIQDGLKDLVKVIKRYNIKSIAIPPLGCGYGGLRWEDVCKEIDKTLGSIKNIEILTIRKDMK